MNTLLFTSLVILIALISVPYASFFEWILHKYFMHRITFGFKYSFRGHQQVHHSIFNGGKNYKLPNHPPEKQDEHIKTIPMAWWNWMVLLAFASVPVLVISRGFFSVWWPSAVTSAVFLGYYCTYEYFHWCMHDPKGRWFENKKWFLNLDRRHNLHHKDFKVNFNVVWPFADWLFGTLRR